MGPPPATRLMGAPSQGYVETSTTTSEDGETTTTPGFRTWTIKTVVFM